VLVGRTQLQDGRTFATACWTDSIVGARPGGCSHLPPLPACADAAYRRLLFAFTCKIKQIAMLHPWCVRFNRTPPALPLFRISAFLPWLSACAAPRFAHRKTPVLYAAVKDAAARLTAFYYLAISAPTPPTALPFVPPPVRWFFIWPRR